jgi:hypothetical protein
VYIQVAEQLITHIGGMSNTNINTLRLLRVFRVLRLFNKFPAMRRVILALTASLKPVLNSFIILVVVISIYAIIGVHLWGTNYPERFKSFFLGWFTMLGVMTGDSWTTEAIELSTRINAASRTCQDNSYRWGSEYRDSEGDTCAIWAKYPTWCVGSPEDGQVDLPAKATIFQNSSI